MITIWQNLTEIEDGIGGAVCFLLPKNFWWIFEMFFNNLLYISFDST